MPEGEILNYQNLKISPAGLPDNQSMRTIFFLVRHARGRNLELSKPQDFSRWPA
jgi:hypothetical protein